VVFLTILAIATKGVGNVEPLGVIELFAVEVLGGLLLGAIIGYLGLHLLKIIDNEHTEIEVLVTLSMVLGGGSIADVMHVSGPLAMVTMGLFVGRKGRTKELENAAGEYVYKFWHLMDEAMNAILFILIGLQIIVIHYELHYFYAAGLAILVVLFARFIGVGIPISVMRIKRNFPKYTIRILTWSGLRGGISVALALSLYETTNFATRTVDIIITMTYCVVLFSIVVQGLTVKKLFDKFSAVNKKVKS
ncbi:MAG: cation:proton antiporter, partial [Fulvivirga sp.]|nr:cation:proton antiporter [Fulvivirga sp.]